VTERNRAEAAAVAVLAAQRGAHGRHLADQLEERGSALALLDDDWGVNPAASRLFKEEEPHVQDLLDTATDDLARWEREGIRMLTVLDPDYPDNLRAVHDRPPLIFVAGELQVHDRRSVAVIGSRKASPRGLSSAGEIAQHLVERSYTVVSGLAAGIDTAAHTAVLMGGGRTVAVIGTGLHHAYPPDNAALQHRIVRHGAVVSRFWPQQGPTRRTFPARNAVMSGLSKATVIVEAGPISGARAQARMALAHGRPVFLHRALLSEDWARELAAKPGACVFRDPHEITDSLDRLEDGALVA
jgi:DNA processing protein